MNKLTITSCNTIDEIRSTWAAIDEKSLGQPDVMSYTFYQTLPWNEFVYETFRKTAVARLGLKSIDFIIASVDGSPVAILPLLVSKHGKKLEFISWKTSGCNNMSCMPLENDCAQNVAWEIVKYILNKYVGYRLKLFDIPSHSPLALAIRELCPGAKISERSSFHIPLDQYPNYDAYFKSLSSHQRQNVRTLYNTISKQGLSVQLKVFESAHLPSRAYLRKVWSLYFKRKAIWRNKNRGLFSGIVNRFEVIREMSSIRTKSLYQLAAARLFTLEINGTLMAFMLTYVGSDGRIVVPKLAIHPAYTKYSPGSALLVETIKWCYDKGVTDFDLSRGDEVYKRRFGGIEETIIRVTLQ